MFARALVALALASSACTSSAAPPAPTVSEPPAESPERGGDRRFDDLTMTLELDSDTVEAGADLRARVLVENRTGSGVVDPGCWLTASSAAIVPPDDPDAELWRQVVVDCEGPHTIHPGDDEDHMLHLVAATKYGEPLPPGDYVVAVEYRGLSRRLEAPVTVTE